MVRLGMPDLLDSTILVVAFAPYYNDENGIRLQDKLDKSFILSLYV